MKVRAYQGDSLPVDILSLQFSLAQIPVIAKLVADQHGFYFADIRAETSLAVSVEGVIGKPMSALFQDTRALMCVPLVAKGEVVGMLTLAHDQSGYYQAETMEKVRAFANQVAIAIDNAHLYRHSQEVAVVAERNRIASDLHDSVTQALFSATLITEVLPKIWEQDPEEGKHELAKLRRLTRGALAEMRTMLLELRPRALERTNLSDLLEQLTELLTSQENVEVTSAIDPVPDLPPDVQIAFYRVAQESLNNVLKHARAEQVTISLRALPPYDPNQEEWRGRVALHVSDDGRGYHPDQVAAEQMGLKIMAERAESISAQLNLTSKPGEGTQVVLVWENN
jgi:two-component system nitrate/nitrite sensor histidine kinase NarX